MWFALKFVSLHKDKHPVLQVSISIIVVICFKIRIFAQRQTSRSERLHDVRRLWFALKFVSLHKDKHLLSTWEKWRKVVICFKIRIFAQRQTSIRWEVFELLQLWFALKFVSLHKDKHLREHVADDKWVVICFKIRIFAQRQTSKLDDGTVQNKLWFALKFVSLHKDKHQYQDNGKLRRSCDLL